MQAIIPPFWLIIAAVITISFPSEVLAGSLGWPVACIPGENCKGSTFYIGYPDIDRSGKAFDCGNPGYTGHTGTDITVSSVKDGIPVRAAADGEVLLVSGGKVDHCSGDGGTAGGCLQDIAATEDPGTICLGADGCFSWGFDAGNFILIRHGELPQALFTLYAHLRRGSIAVTNGNLVKKGEKIAEVGNSGASLTPHLHFGVFARRLFGNELVDPWQGSCSPDHHQTLWQYDPPYRADVFVIKAGTGEGIITCDSGGISCPTSSPASFIPGTFVTFKAVPYYGSQFIGWQEGCSGNAKSCTITVEGSIAVKALFARGERRP
ncbi:zinc metalloendopeptidase M23 domain protein [Geotalea daltonii FRC-32]|uniref:Zinc metalloendopeptidase M23 domain protein n=1 Tax=Geotalea daltonii (strain DSM 22248 / JCM 15807 / FRC-32) TaxID=316067 RepID=B9M2P0_GEODF|nr:M23 family metallopeptidase [Geotalea daltonii]ACM19419.1 zinc metalloendopeptidase M23 domain protein [Geotalea daltonii FRC-32]